MKISSSRSIRMITISCLWFVMALEEWQGEKSLPSLPVWPYDEYLREKQTLAVKPNHQGFHSLRSYSIFNRVRKTIPGFQRYGQHSGNDCVRDVDTVLCGLGGGFPDLSDSVTEKIIFRSKDHSYRQLLIDNGMLEEDDPNIRHIITQAVGGKSKNKTFSG